MDKVQLVVPDSKLKDFSQYKLSIFGPSEDTKSKETHKKKTTNRNTYKRQMRRLRAVLR